MWCNQNATKKEYTPEANRRGLRCGNPPPNQPNPEISEAVQQALNSMMPGLITQVVEVVRQAGGTATPNNVGGTGLTSSARDIELDMIDFLATKGDSKKKSRNSSFGSQSGQANIQQKYNSLGQRKKASSRSSLSSKAASNTVNLTPPTQWSHG
ncbi:hypothetical protein L6452_09215 [Arctium lappa]|uniref:Uncharacterized protein n=1 Tax=Arctium lappa TaxID=4217 RepID=A0ACB9DJQ8_ARCLA|nr:hypothetical protein L6452_09215 [Arctium lappa]